MHWLDEIEKRESRKRGSASGSARIQDKKFRIGQNYEKNREIYNGFMAKLEGLAERVNSLPMEHREVFGKVGFKLKDTKLKNHLFYLSSSRRMQKTEFKSLLRPLRTVHYKHIRVIYFNVAKLMDKVEIEIHEEYLEKKRRDGKVIPEHENPKGFHKPQSDRNKFHEIYYYEMEKLTDELAYQIIDWLAFREEVDHIPVVTEGEARFKE
ncbi:MAG: hypothetical protein K0B08_05320 [Bacteroidales bacterium]|nr:hypothetical protein [Bacteroidales bacterium]